MITNFKIFEKVGYPQVDDYVLIRTNSSISFINEFINNTIGQIIEIKKDSVDRWGHVITGFIIVEYKDVPEDIQSWFSIVNNHYFRYFDKSQIVAYSKTPEELEINLSANKYNI